MPETKPGTQQRRKRMGQILQRQKAWKILHSAAVLGRGITSLTQAGGRGWGGGERIAAASEPAKRHSLPSQKTSQQQQQQSMLS